MSDPTLPADTPTLGASGTLPGADAAPVIASRDSSREPRPGDVIGRYVVLHVLGRGGMGVVLAAFDPELDRKVALKLLQSQPGTGDRAARQRDRLLREARVMAQLSHPNIVAVHDVGEHEGRVFLAMEHVAGRTLAQWRDEGPHTWQETLAVYLAAAQGLAAAHAEGLVHRDFKPDNVMIDEHERVRVMDFGLALRREESSRDSETRAELSRPLGAVMTEAGRLMGTPAYMSPEQWSQTEADARSDQFSFCVALFEALHGQRPFAGSSVPEIAASVLAGEITSPPDASRVPAWLDRVLRRGLALDPAARFESMNQCVEALARGQAQRRRRMLVLAGAGLGLAGLGALAVARVGEHRRVEACESGGAAIEASWNPSVAAELRGAFVDTEVSFAEPSADTVVAHFDRFAESWRSTRTAVCLGAESQGAARVERAEWCLDEQRAQLDALVQELRAVDRATIEHAVDTAMSLANVEPCGDPIALQRLSVPEPTRRASALELHRDIARGLALARAGRKQDGLALALEARRRAQALEWPPLVAAASQAVGEIQWLQERYAEAEVSLEDAFFAARAAEATSIEAEVASSLVGVVGDELGRHGDGLRWSRNAALALDRLGESAALSRATMLSHRGMVEHGGGNYEGAAEDLEQALAIDEAQLGVEHPRVATVVTELGLVAWEAGRYDEADALHRRALAITESSLGANHPGVARALNNLAIVHESWGHYEQAEALHRRARSIYEALYGLEHTDVAMSLNNLGVIAIAQGRVEEARAFYTQAVEIWERVLGPDHPDVARGLVNLAVAMAELGDEDEARRLYLRALEIQRRTLGPMHPTVGETLNNLGVNRFEAGAYADALDLYDQSLRIFEQALGPDHQKVATALDNLAEAALASGDLARAEPLYRRALAIHEQTQGLDHPDLAYTLVGLAQLELARAAPGRALPLITRAVRIREAVIPDDAYTAEARFVRARALFDAPESEGGDRPGALREAEAAEGLYRGLEGHAEQADEVARWRQEHDRLGASDESVGREGVLRGRATGRGG